MQEESYIVGPVTRRAQAKPRFLTIIIAEYQFARFQMREFPHSYALIWTSDCPLLTSENNRQAYSVYTQNVQAFLPNKDTEP